MSDINDEILRELTQIRIRLTHIEDVLEQPQRSTVNFTFTGENSVHRARDCAELVTRQLGSAFDRAMANGSLGGNDGRN